MPLAVVLQFLPVYHALHDVGGVHTEICVLVLFGFYCMLAWIGDRHAGVEARPSLVPGMYICTVFARSEVAATNIFIP